MVITNILIMVGMLTFVIFYSYTENENANKRKIENYETQIQNFENTTITMEQVTENYLEGEQRICDVWAHYINKKDMTIEEAISFIRISHVLPNASAHIIYADTLTGQSTRPRSGTTDDFDVSYVGTELLSDISWIHEIGTAINISRSYTNPINGEQSIAFCNFIKINDIDEDAILLRVLPISELKRKWVFPHESFKSADLSIIDSNGDYIIKGDTFKNSSFFEFYKSYNKNDNSYNQELFAKITSSTGSFNMYNSRGEECILSYTPLNTTGGLTLLNFMPTKDLYNDTSNTENWLLIGIVSSGLFILFVFDLAVMSYFNKKLKITAKEADSANKAKTDFLSTMSHDIRTPMNAIIGLTTIIEKNIDNKKLVMENIHKISLASNHLLTLINDILDISKVESGKLNLVPQAFSIVETVDNLMNLSQPMIKEKKIDFSFRVSRFEKEYLYADQLRINQIYINILSNAIKYTEPNGRIIVDMSEEESQKPGCVKLTYRVEDNGIGMSPEFLANLYQPFSRQTDSRVNRIQGSGLGLAITKKMVDLMEGNIDCQSEQGKGTTFTVTLDLPIAEQQKVELKLNPMDVLIVDDDEVLIETASETLESLGLHVDKARNGTEAIEMIKNRKEANNDYSVAIIDLKMPDMDGVETIRRIRTDAKSSVPTLLISAYDLTDIEKKAKEAGASGFLSKPIFRSTIYDKINEILGIEAESVESENEYSDLEGLNILVTEDNDINWEIISTLLSMYGINTERAENGRICVDKIKEAEKDKYMLIFMDIQMPEMNGLDATRAIRSLSNHWAKNIPIIAMTADAFSENITECLETGMNGHIAKPIDIKLVLKEIRRIKEETKQ